MFQTTSFESNYTPFPQRYPHRPYYIQFVAHVTDFQNDLKFGEYICLDIDIPYGNMKPFFDILVLNANYTAKLPVWTIIRLHYFM